MLVILCWLESGSNCAFRNSSDALSYVLRGLAYAFGGQTFRFRLPGGFFVAFSDCVPRNIETL
jgi:hypothetical protein